ncbi:hypothetical protein CH337_21850 [Rhodoblastus acidophilus]|nr:hypothetical protein CH337_21850 [Rhodoblastus acidophilus]
MYAAKAKSVGSHVILVGDDHHLPAFVTMGEDDGSVVIGPGQRPDRRAGEPPLNRLRLAGRHEDLSMGVDVKRNSVEAKRRRRLIVL